MGYGSHVSRRSLEATSCFAKGASLFCLEATSFSLTGYDATDGKLVPLLFLSLEAMLREGNTSSLSFAQSPVELP